MTKPIASVHKKMSTSKAYVYLAAALLLTWIIVQTPLNKISDQRSTIERLKLEISQADIKAQNQSNAADLYNNKLAALFSNGEISLQTNSADIAKELQSTFKRAIAESKASIQLMTPSRASTQQGFVEHNLETSFNIKSNELGNFLAVLSGSFPKPRVSSISLRPTSTYSGLKSEPVSQPRVLNVQLNLIQLATEGLNPLPSITLNNTSNESDKPTINTSDLAQNNTLEALFNPAARQRLRNPSLDYYRLSAITINDRSRSILLVDKQTGLSKRLEIGESIVNWTLSEIKPNEAILTKQDDKTTLKLN